MIIFYRAGISRPVFYFPAKSYRDNTVGIASRTPANLRSSPWCLQTDLEWDPVPDATSYQLEYKKTSASTWNVQYGLTTNYTTIYGSAGYYDWRVKTNCAGGSGNYAASTTTIMVVWACDKRAGIKPEAGGEMKLHPQPAASQVTISYHSDIAVKGIITIHDQFGAVRLNKTVKISEGDNSIALNIGSLKQGVYIIKLQAGEQLVSQKLIVSK